MADTKVNVNMIGDGQVATNTIAPDAVTTAKVIDGTLTNADFAPTANISVSKLNSPGSAADFLRGDGVFANSDTTAINEVAFNIGVLGFKMAVNEGLTLFNLVDGVVDEFNSEGGIDTTENSNAKYDSGSDFYSNLEGPNPIPSPTALLTRVTTPGPGTYSNEPTTTVVKVFAVGGGGAGGGGGMGSGGSGGGGAGGVVLDADVPVTGGASVAINVGTGGEGMFQPTHPTYSTSPSNPYFPADWPSTGPLSVADPAHPGGTHSRPGNDTTFGPTITAEGGGAGGHAYTFSEPASDPLFPGLELTDGFAGGSGGGAGYQEGVVGEGETGENRHPAGDFTQQGFDGGLFNPGAPYGGGGGGGAGAAGSTAVGSPTGGGSGGTGIAVGPPNPQLNWMPTGYGHPDGFIAGGGSGGTYAPGPETAGGAGGGGDGNHEPQSTNTTADELEYAGAANTGGGGGGHGGGPGGSGPSYYNIPGGDGGSGQIVVLEMEALTTSTSSTLISDTFTANSAPTKARIVVFAEISDDLNTDVTASVTRDNTTFDAVTLTDSGYVTGSSGTKVFTGSTPLTGTASPQVQLRWKIVGSNQTAENKIHGVSLQWA